MQKEALVIVEYYTLASFIALFLLPSKLVSNYWKLVDHYDSQHEFWQLLH